MNYPSISGRGIPHSLPVAAGLTFCIAGLILALSAPNAVYAGDTQVQHNATANKSVGAQTRRPGTSTGREYRIKEDKPHKSGVVRKNPQRSNTRQELDQEEKAGTGSFTNRDQGGQRKVRRALA